MESDCGRYGGGDEGMVSGYIFGEGSSFVGGHLGRSEKPVGCRVKESGIWDVESAWWVVCMCDRKRVILHRGC